MKKEIKKRRISFIYNGRKVRINQLKKGYSLFIDKEKIPLEISSKPTYLALYHLPYVRFQSLIELAKSVIDFSVNSKIDMTSITNQQL